MQYEYFYNETFDQQNAKDILDYDVHSDPLAFRNVPNGKGDPSWFSRYAGPQLGHALCHRLLTRSAEYKLFSKYNLLKYLGQQGFTIDKHIADISNIILANNYRLCFKVIWRMTFSTLYWNSINSSSYYDDASNTIKTKEQFAELFQDAVVFTAGLIPKFDPFLGNRFATFAYRSIARHIHRKLLRLAKEKQQQRPLDHEPYLESNLLKLDEYDEYQFIHFIASSVGTFKELQVLESRYGLNGREPKTYEQIADELHLTRQRVHQITSRFETKIRDELIEIGICEPERNSQIELPQEETPQEKPIGADTTDNLQRAMERLKITKKIVNELGGLDRAIQIMGLLDELSDMGV